MEDRFDATFVVQCTPDATWRVLVDCRRDDTTWWLPGFVTEAEVVDVDEGRELHARKVEEPCAGTDIVVTIEADQSGTKVTIVQSGFGEMFRNAFDAMAIGWRHIVADFAAYLERGIDGGRHLRPWAMLGCNVHETTAGLEVDAVWGGYAQTVGLQPGDLLLTVAGAPIVTRPELETVMRIFGPGTEIETTWARARTVSHATAPL